VRRLEFSSELGNALFHAGRLTDAKTVLATAVQDATRLGHEKLSLVAAVHLADLGIHTGSDASLDDTLALARHAAEVFEAAGDDRALIHAWEVIHSVGFARGDVVGSLPFAERALAAAERIGDIGRQAAERGSIIALLFYGPSALDECIPSLEDTLTWARANGSRWLEALTLRFLGEAIFEQGRLREGRELRLRGELIREEIGQPVAKASGQGDFSIGEVAIDGAAVEARMRAGYDTLKALEEKGFLSTVAANLSQVLYWRGRYEEADHLALESESLGVEGDVTTQVGWRAARAMLHARRGDISQGEALARDAVERATATQYFSLIPESYLALGEVHRIAERDRKSAEALEQALRAYAEKGFILSADTVRARLAELPTQSRA
jgi:tetratricopeptide (TPR) repeat protein